MGDDRNGRRKYLEAVAFLASREEHKARASWQSCGGDSLVANPAVATVNACSEENSSLSSHAEAKQDVQGAPFQHDFSPSRELCDSLALGLGTSADAPVAVSRESYQTFLNLNGCRDPRSGKGGLTTIISIDRRYEFWPCCRLKTINK